MDDEQMIEGSLRRAAEGGRFKIFDMLIDDFGSTVPPETLAEILQSHVLKMPVSSIERCVEKGASLFQGIEYGPAPLEILATSVEHTHSKKLEQLLAPRKSQLLEHSKNHPWNLLFCAASAAAVCNIRVLLSVGMDPKSNCPVQSTPYHAIGRNVPATVGADKRHQLIKAAIELLDQAGGDIHAQNWYQELPLHEACTRADLQAMECFLARGQDPNHCAMRGTAAHYLVSSAESDLDALAGLEMLIKRGATLTQPSVADLPSLVDLAQDHNLVQTAARIQSHKALFELEKSVPSASQVQRRL